MPQPEGDKTALKGEKKKRKIEAGQDEKLEEFEYLKVQEEMLGLNQGQKRTHFLSGV